MCLNESVGICLSVCVEACAAWNTSLICSIPLNLWIDCSQLSSWSIQHRFSSFVFAPFAYAFNVPLNWSLMCSVCVFSRCNHHHQHQQDNITASSQFYITWKTSCIHISNSWHPVVLMAAHTYKILLLSHRSCVAHTFSFQAVHHNEDEDNDNDTDDDDLNNSLLQEQRRRWQLNYFKKYADIILVWI